MANVTKELVLNETFMSTEQTPRNVADILADELENIASAIEGGSSGVVDVEVNGTSVVDPTTKIAEVTSYEEVTESEYEAIPVAERESNGIAYFIKDLNNESVQGYPPLIYSDEEREIGVWRDGKPLYQKTIDVAPLPNNTIKEIQLDTDIERIISMRGYGIDSNDKWDVFFNDVVPTSVSGSIRVFANTANQKLYISTAQNLTSYTEAYVTIQYTKTTDVAGSGIWNGQGGIAHHYSLSETVIGTWIDGKPLYEKVVEFPNSISVTSQWIDTNMTITDGDIVVYSCGIYGNKNPISWVSSKITSNKLYVTATTNVTINKLILQYTKTTD